MKMADTYLESSDDEKNFELTEKNDNVHTRHSKFQVFKKSDFLIDRIQKAEGVVKSLENSLVESEHTDHQMVIALRSDNIKNQKLASQLEEARKENKQLLNIIQQRCGDSDFASRTSSRSQLDICSFSTVSMVHLQYKYEELLSSHESLLKLLESRADEVQNCNKENGKLREDIRKLNMQLAEYEQNVHKLCEKYLALKKRKDTKINKLKAERNTLKIIHEQLVKLLNDQCLERDRFLEGLLESSDNSDKSLLLQEVRRTNRLQFENTQLRQELLYYRSKCCNNPVENKPIF